MASKNPVAKRVEISRVSPYSNSPHSFSDLSLTFFDAIWLNFPPVEYLFFYQLPQLTLLHFNSHILPRLKHSLSLTLHHYLPLAGKLTWPPHADVPTISFSPDDAVSFLVAEADADFNRLSGDDIRESHESRHLIPELLTCEEKASCIALQITLFPNQGFCIGVSAHRAVMDGQTTITFLKSWAYLCTQLAKEHPSLLPELTPFFDRTVVKDPIGLCRVYLKNWIDFTGSPSLKVLEDLGVNRNSVRATFKLSDEDVKKLRKKILNKLEEVKPIKPLHLSTFVVTYAYVLVCLVKVKCGESNRNVSIMFPVDYRNRLDPPLTATYFGNCVWARGAIVKASVFMEGHGVANIAEKASNMVREIDEKGLFEGGEEGLAKLMDLKEGEESIGIAGSNRFKFYEVDYGWGRPKKVEIPSIDKTGAIAMLGSRDGNGVEIGLVLSRHEMEIFKSLFVSGLQDL